MLESDWVKIAAGRSSKLVGETWFMIGGDRKMAGQRGVK